MSATANLNDDAVSIVTDKDSIVIVDCFATIRGGRTLDVTGFALPVIPAGHVIIKETSTSAYKPLPATPASSGNLATLGTVVPGTGYTNGTYENVPLTGGSGSGAKATVVVASTVVSTVTVTSPGKDYVVADSLSFDASTVGGTGSGASVPVATIGSANATFGSLPSGHTYAGILNASILTKKPMASILTQGTVNPSAMPFDPTSILSALKTALPLIDFRAD